MAMRNTQNKWSQWLYAFISKAVSLEHFDISIINFSTVQQSGSNSRKVFWTFMQIKGWPVCCWDICNSVLFKNIQVNALIFITMWAENKSFYCERARTFSMGLLSQTFWKALFSKKSLCKWIMSCFGHASSLHVMRFSESVKIILGHAEVVHCLHHDGRSKREQRET